LNNTIEKDHRGVKARTGQMAAAITLAGIELMRRIYKRQSDLSRLRHHGKAAPGIWNTVLVE
jgi:transposase-like protein